MTNDLNSHEKSSFTHTLKKASLPVLLSSIMLAACGNAKTTEDKKNPTATTETTTKVDGQTESVIKTTLKKNLKASGFDTEITSIRATQMPDLYWVTTKDLPAFFTDKTGTYVIQGDVVKIGGATPVDISTKIKQEDAKQLLAKVDKKDMVIFKPKGEVKGVVYAFTDVDCGYCRKLHSEMADINKKGIEVRYLAWPRSPQSIPAMQNIWCAEDRNIAMNTGKSGGTLETKTCDNPIEAQVELGHQLGVRGTPAIFTEYGAQIGGYLPASQLAKVATQ